MGVLNLGLGQLFSETTSGAVTLRDFLLVVGLSFVLSVFIGWVYQRTYRGSRYSQDYVHTLVIMGTVVSIVIMLVGGNLARAFGIFAVFSIIRFRRALPEARDIGFIFFTMAAGLAAGAYQYEFAILTTVLVSGVVLFISRYDLFASRRSMLKLRIEVPNDLDYEAVFVEPFGRLFDGHTLRSVRYKGSSDLLELRYDVDLTAGVRPQDVVNELKSLNTGLRVVMTFDETIDTEF